MQLEYAKKNPASRWKMPAKWYALELPDAEHPLLKIIVLDTNLQEGALTPQEKLAQMRFLEAELAKGTKAPWQWLVCHHPIFTETTKRKDNTKLLRLLDNALAGAVALEGRADEPAEQRMRVGRPRAQLGVRLRRDVVRVDLARQLDVLDKVSVGREAREEQARAGQPVAVGVVDLVAVAMALVDA